jgi:hypothetical protein
MRIPAEGTAKELLRAGRDQLRTLQLKRRLARYEVALAELQAAVDKAERGDPQPLQRWLAAADPKWLVGTESEPLAEQAARHLRSELAAADPPSATGSLATTPAEPGGPAEQVVVEDRSSALLVAVDTEVGKGSDLGGPTGGPQPEAVPPEANQGRPSLDKPLKANLSQDKLSQENRSKDKPSQDKEVRTAVAAARSPGSNRAAGPISHPPTAAVRASGQRLQDGVPRRRPEAPKRLAGPPGDSAAIRHQAEALRLLAELPEGEPTSKPRGRGLAAAISLIAHGLLLGWLLLVTLKHPSQPRMQFQAARAPTAEVPIELVPELEWPDTDATLQVDSHLPPQLEATAEGFEGPRLLEQFGDVLGPSTESLAGPASAAVGGSGQSAALAGVQFFGAQAAGNNFVYIVDSSGSMRRGGAFDIARQELLRSIAALQPHQRYYIFFFHAEIHALTLGGDQPEATLVYPTPENLAATQAWVQSIEPGTGENPKRVLQRALSLDPDAIFLLTDGEFPDWVVSEFLAEANRVDDFLVGLEPRVPIHAVAFAAHKLEDQLRMQRLAAENAGQYRLVPVEVPPRRSVGRQ